MAEGFKTKNVGQPQQRQKIPYLQVGTIYVGAKTAFGPPLLQPRLDDEPRLPGTALAAKAMPVRHVPPQ